MGPTKKLCMYRNDNTRHSSVQMTVRTVKTLQQDNNEYYVKPNEEHCFTNASGLIITGIITNYGNTSWKFGICNEKLDCEGDPAKCEELIKEIQTPQFAVDDIVDVKAVGQWHSGIVIRVDETKDHDYFYLVHDYVQSRKRNKTSKIAVKAGKIRRPVHEVGDIPD